MELIDLYDENRKPIGKTIKRGEPISEGEYKLSVHMWIMNGEGKIYIQKRAGVRKLFPNKWENPGGGVVAGDDSIKTLKKEFEEELGIELTGKSKLIKSIKRQKDFVDIYHVIQDFQIDDLNLQKEEVECAKWATLDEIMKMIENGDFCPTIMESLNPFIDYLKSNKLRKLPKKKLCELSRVDGVEIYLPTYYLYKKTMKNNFNCCDICVRFLAIDNYYGKNTNGFEIYNEVQHYRVSTKKVIPRHQYDNEEAFRKLIKSFENKGFDKEYPLCLNKNFMVIDGAHRLALALYFGIDKVPVCFKEKHYDVDFDYSLKWMRKNGFGKYEHLMKEQFERIKNKYEGGEENV